MVVKRVYALYGAPDSGKTSVLNSLINKLTAEHCSYDLLESIGESDRVAIFDVKGRKIGICTQGDYVTQVESNLNKLEGHCDIIFCATRTKGETCEHVITRFSDKLTWIQNAGIFDQKVAHDNRQFLMHRNSSMAELLYNLIG